MDYTTYALCPGARKPVGEYYSYIDDFDRDPEIPIRMKRMKVNTEEDDFSFQLSDITIKRDVINDETERKEVEVYLHGNAKNGETVSLLFRGYKPYFYLTLNEQWRPGIKPDALKAKHKESYGMRSRVDNVATDSIIQELKEERDDFPFHEVCLIHLPRN